MKATDEIGLIETHFVREGSASSIVSIRNPNLNEKGYLKSTPNPTLVLFLKGATYI